MQRKIFITFLFLLIALLFVWMIASRPRLVSPQTSDATKLHVIASFYPIAEFARAVGGDFVTVTTITPAGTEPHEYEPTVKQIAEVYQSDVFLYNGGGIDAWASRIASDIALKQIATNELSQSIKIIAEAGSGDPTHNSFDPHFWLDPVLAQKEVLSIADTFSKRDPSHANVYKTNADDYIAKLSKLDQSYKDELASCGNRTVVTSHAAFAYLAKQYNFDVIAISGLSPEEEPSAGRLAEIVKLANEKNIAFIYFETLASPKLSQTIANEIGAKTLVFNPLEGVSDEDQAIGKNYLSIMQENLKNLKIGMLCP